MESATGLDLDHLLIEEFKISPAFTDWFIGKLPGFECGTYDRIVATPRTRGPVGNSERDLRIDLLDASGSQKACLLIENKASATFSTDQAKFRFDEIQTLKKSMGHHRAMAILVAPERYAIVENLSYFDGHVTLEDMRDFFESMKENSEEQSEALRRVNFKLNLLHKYIPKHDRIHEDSKSYFESSDRSFFVEFVRGELEKFATPDQWNVGGARSLTANFKPMTEAIALKHGPGLKAQIWMERPRNTSARCNFEVVGKILTLEAAESVRTREMIASDIRDKMVDVGLPDGVSVSRRSTVCTLRFSGIYESDYSKQNPKTAKPVSREIKKFVEFLEKSLNIVLKLYISSN